MTEAAGPSRAPGPLMTAAFAYQRFSDRFSDWMGKISQYMVIITLAIGFTNVVLRYTGELSGTRLTNNGMIEAQWYAYSLIFLFGFGYILKHQINVRVDFWFANQSRRVKAWIDMVGHLISLIPFCVIGIYISVPQVVTSWELWEQSPDPSGLPRAPIKTMIVVGLTFLLLQGIAELVKLYAVLRGYQDEHAVEEPEAPIRVE